MLELALSLTGVLFAGLVSARMRMRFHRGGGHLNP